MGGNGAFLMDLSSKYIGELLIVGAHPPCCDNDNTRQREIDAIMAFVRNSKNGTGPIPISNEIPILITYDMNLVEIASALSNLTSPPGRMNLIAGIKKTKQITAVQQEANSYPGLFLMRSLVWIFPSAVKTMTSLGSMARIKLVTKSLCGILLTGFMLPISLYG